MSSKTCLCIHSRHLSDTDTPALRHFGLDVEKSSTRQSTLKRRGSTLQTSVEVLRCKFGKPTVTPETSGEIKPSKEWTPMFFAVYHQREAALSHFLRAGASPDDVTGTGQPPLCIAVASGYIGIAKILLDAGANIDAATKEGGETALHIAVKNGRSDLIELVTSYSPNFELKTNESGETPLHYAASRSGSLAAVMTLLKHGASYDTLNAKGQTPAEAALEANNINGAVAIINAANNERNKLAKEKEMLLKHVKKTQGRFSIGNDLIADIFAAACDPESNVLVEAIKRNDSLLVEMFLEKGSDPDRQTAQGLRPIFAALACADAPVVKALLKRNPDLSVRDDKGLSVLQATLESPLAQEKKSVEIIIGSLLEQGTDAKVRYTDGKTLLHHAVTPRFSQTKIAQMLVDAGAEVNAQDDEGNTALHLATYSKSCTDLLLKSKADPKKTNAKGLTPLLFAMTCNEKETEPDLESLVKVSDMRRTNSEEHTALHLAAKRGLGKTIRALLRNRADTTAVDCDKNTPLLLAVKNHQWSVVSLLAKYPNANAWDRDGLSALHHIVSTLPKSPSTWQDIAAATAPFCERGVSRSIRDRTGATPLILAIKTLPDEGLPVIETLLVQRTNGQVNWNFADHEDHKRHDALFYAATMGKPIFVQALLKNGATFAFGDWAPETKKLQLEDDVSKQVLKLFAEQEWIRRATSLRRQSGGLDAEISNFQTVLPIRDLEVMMSMGLDISALPLSPLGTSLLWAVLKQIPRKPTLSSVYLIDALHLILDGGADPNKTTTRKEKRSSWPTAEPVPAMGPPLNLYPLTFLLEECLDIDIEVVRLFLAKDAKLNLPSAFYSGRFPLHSAVKAQRTDVVEELLLELDDVDCVDQAGRTPLYIAAENGYWEIADALLARNARADTLDLQKNTLLHAAAFGGSKKAVETLLSAGVKASSKNVKGLTALVCVPEDLAKDEKSDILSILKDAEEKERKDGEERLRLEREKATQMAKAKQLEEEVARLQLQKDQEEKDAILKKESEIPAAAAAPEEQQFPRPLAVAAKPSSPPPTKRRSSLFRKPSQIFQRVKSTTSPSDSTSKPKHTSFLSLRINTPSTSKQAQQPPPPSLTFTAIPQSPSTPHILASPDFFNTDFPQNAGRSSIVALPSSIQKRLPSARVDSGFGVRNSSGKSEILDLEAVNKKLSEQGRERDTERVVSGQELSDWLEVSRMLDGIEESPLALSAY
ncbi:ankyrin repeat-containing protein [Stemphylium lycopersici]|nr:ankyrin repeat-containing protein [Stemphylium lycopersici]RAR03463.1 ankyrin repeat-containing protein [Stemphylium lycopersici]